MRLEILNQRRARSGCESPYNALGVRQDHPIGVHLGRGDCWMASAQVEPTGIDPVTHLVIEPKVGERRRLVPVA